MIWVLLIDVPVFGAILNILHHSLQTRLGNTTECTMKSEQIQIIWEWVTHVIGSSDSSNCDSDVNKFCVLFCSAVQNSLHVYSSVRLPTFKVVLLKLVERITSHSAEPLLWPDYLILPSLCDTQLCFFFWSTLKISFTESPHLATSNASSPLKSTVRE